MPLLKVAFRVTHDCPFGNFSRKFPSSKMLVWCDREHEVIEVSSYRPSERSRIRKEIRAVVGGRKSLSEGGSIQIFTKRCHCTIKNSVSRNMDAHNMLHLMPIYYEDGWEYFNAIALKHGDFKRFAEAVERLPGELEVIRKSSLDGSIGSTITVSVKDLFATLTSRQVEALLASYYMGYFRFPRRTNVVEIARARSVARTTFQEHLTKAEDKLVTSLVPYLQLFQHQPKRPGEAV